MARDGMDYRMGVEFKVSPPEGKVFWIKIVPLLPEGWAVFKNEVLVKNAWWSYWAGAQMMMDEVCAAFGASWKDRTATKKDIDPIPMPAGMVEERVGGQRQLPTVPVVVVPLAEYRSGAIYTTNDPPKATKSILKALGRLKEVEA